MRCFLFAAITVLGIVFGMFPADAAQEVTEIDAMIAALEKAKAENSPANPEVTDNVSEAMPDTQIIEELPDTMIGEVESSKKAEEVVILDVFSPEFMASLRVCREDSESKDGRTFSIVGMRDNLCYLTYGNYVLRVPVSVLANIHSFDDLHTLLKNKDMARYKYVPEYTYEGLVFALASCVQKEKFYGVEEEETRVDAVITRGLSSDYFDGRCEVYLQEELELEGEVRDYGVTCKIEQKKLERLKPYFADVAEKYKNIKVIESHENKEILNADIKLMHYLQQHNFCRRNNTFLD